jgi:sec-independent protein translocase protein TatA
MGQLGFTEMLVIFVAALLLFGPKKLPELGKSLGKGIREFRKATDELKNTWEDQVRDIKEPLNDVKKDIRGMQQDLQNDIYRSVESTYSEPEPAPTRGPETPAEEAAAAAAAAPQATESESTTPKEHV